MPVFSGSASSLSSSETSYHTERIKSQIVELQGQEEGANYWRRYSTPLSSSTGRREGKKPQATNSPLQYGNLEDARLLLERPPACILALWRKGSILLDEEGKMVKRRGRV
jgi:hypothetical protein